MFAARSQHLSELIEPTLKKGIWVVCDRFTDATMAYQGGGRGINETTITQLANIVTRQEDQDRFETEIDDFKQRVRNKYLEIAQQEPERVKLIDASPEVSIVTQSVKNTILRFCQQHGIQK